MAAARGFLRTGVFIAFGLLLASCGHVSVSTLPSTALNDGTAVFVAPNPADEKHLHVKIAEALRHQGYTVLVNQIEAEQQGAIFVDYASTWKWDLLPYLKELTINFRNPADGVLVASATSYRSSLERRSSKGMIKETLQKIAKSRNRP